MSHDPQGQDPDRAATAGPTVTVLDETTRKTYRYLRVSVVAMAGLLVVSLIIELLWGEGEKFGSISGFYYSPVHSIFVGVLVGFAPALIAIRGRYGWEDTLLDLAGMLIPLVALVPTPRDQAKGVCEGERLRCVPPDLEPYVANNVWALVVVGVIALVFAWRTAGPSRTPAMTTGLRAATGAFVVFTLWFVAFRDLFLLGAHYISAILFFLLIAAVAYLNGRAVKGRSNVRMMTAKRYSDSYSTISVLMIATLVLTLGLYLVGWVAGFSAPDGTIFVVEAILLVLFLVFWVLQTAENWDEEAVEDTAAV